MDTRRLAAISVPLTDEQRELIRQSTGADVSEAVFAAPVSSAAPLENELVDAAGQALAGLVWGNHGDFMQRLDAAPDVKQAFEVEIGHELDPGSTSIAFLR